MLRNVFATVPGGGGGGGAAGGKTLRRQFTSVDALNGLLLHSL